MSATDTAAPRSNPKRWLRVALSLLAVAVICALLATSITVVPDSEVASTDLAGNPTFDAKTYVDSLWAAKVLPLVQDKSADIATVLDAVGKDADGAGARYGHRPKSGDGPWNFVVHGGATIKTAETKLRHATLTVDVGGHDVVLQIGPVVFGTALRDALPFVSFEQVVNQIQFAQVSRELNDRASAMARNGLDAAKLVPGARISFAGAMSAGQPPQVTVVQLHVLP